MVTLGRQWVRGLGLAGAEPVDEGGERVVGDARRGRCCCGDRCRNCGLGLVYVSLVFFLSDLLQSPFHVKQGGRRMKHDTA